MKKIVVASGKGGTGKTTFSVNLALSAEVPVTLLDCDVEEPNCHLFLPGELRDVHTVTLPVPEVDVDRCTGCGKCATACQFNAIVTIKGKALIFPELCHSCGLCASICPALAIDEANLKVGEIITIDTPDFPLVYGSLRVSSPMAPLIIKGVKDRARGEDCDLQIMDAPPGTSCAAVAAVKDSDFVLLVTEPTPFGLHDLTLAVDMVREIGTPFAVAINRSDSGDDRVEVFCRNAGIEIFLKIPEERRIAEAYSIGKPIVSAIPEYRLIFRDLLSRITKEIGA